MPLTSRAEYMLRIQETATMMAVNVLRDDIIAALVEKYGCHPETVERWMVVVSEQWKDSSKKVLAQRRAQAEHLWTCNYFRAIEMDDNMLLAKSTDALCKLWGVYDNIPADKALLSVEDKEHRILAAAKLIEAKSANR